MYRIYNTEEKRFLVSKFKFEDDAEYKANCYNLMYGTKKYIVIKEKGE